MKFEVKTFSDVEYACREIRYYLDHADYDRIYSNRGQILEKSRGLMEPCYVHLWMIMYPLEGQEYTRAKNIADLANWIDQIVRASLKANVGLGSVFVELEGGYKARVKSNLQKHHGYPSLKGVACNEISIAMFNIIARVSNVLDDGLHRDKKYQLPKSTIQEIIKERLRLEI